MPAHGTVWRVLLTVPIWDDPDVTTEVRAGHARSRPFGGSRAVAFLPSRASEAWTDENAEPPTALFRVDQLVGYGAVAGTDRLAVYLRSPTDRGRRFVDVSAGCAVPGTLPGLSGEANVDTLDFKDDEDDPEPTVRFLATFVAGYLQLGR